MTITATELTAEKFLREKLESEIGLFGDGEKEFHTRDIQHLLLCMDDKDNLLIEQDQNATELTNRINFGAERQFQNLLALCMTISNASSDERLGYIRKEYKEIWEKIKP